MFECHSCDECTFEGENVWTLGGGGNTKDECIRACLAQSLCNYASISNDGYCHMTATCYEKSGSPNWKRYKRRGT